MKKLSLVSMTLPFSIKSNLVGVLLLLLILFIVPNAIDLATSFQRLEESKRIAAIINGSIQLFQAVRNLGYERGRANVVLNHIGPLEEMAANREFIAKRRQDGEQALATALNELSLAKLPDTKGALNELNKIRDLVVMLRKKVDCDMSLSMEMRDQNLPKSWFKNMSLMITNIRQMLEVLTKEIVKIDAKAAIIGQLMTASISLRDESAPEMSLLSGAMLSGKPIASDVYLNIVTKRGIALQLIHEMRVSASALESPLVKESTDKFEHLYFNKYLPFGREVLQASMTGGPYPIAQKEFLETGVETIEALVGIMEVITDIGASRAIELHDSAVREFVRNLTVLLLGALLISAILLIVTTNIIYPLAALNQATRRIANRELSMTVPYLDRTNEIGLVARAIDILKSNTIKMIADFDALQKSRDELQKALSEVRTLRGLLPICAACKKIRTDKDQWKQIELYISEHSEAQFSHGICPECAKRLYPEFYED